VIASRRMTVVARASASLLLVALAARAAAAQATLAAADVVTPIDLLVGNSFPISTPLTITRVSVANPDIADVVVISDHELVINARAPGETDAIVWPRTGDRQHFRVSVRNSAARLQVVVAIKFAEVRKDALRELGISGLYRDAHTRVGTGVFGNDGQIRPDGSVITPAVNQFLTVLTDFNTTRLLGYLQLQEQKGYARTLAEPNVMAANREEASFLAGGEIPIPVAQGGGGNLADTRITIQYKEYGIRLHFISDVINDSLVKLNVQPEVSSLDYNNSVVLSGFRIPALLTRRLQTTVDVRRNESLVLTGLFNDERQKVKTGIPLLMDLPILGSLFASTQWQRNESELLIVVTPVLVDPNRPRAQDLLPLAPDTTLPAREAIQPRLTKPSAPPAKPTPSAPVPPAQPPATPPANPPAQPPRR